MEWDYTTKQNDTWDVLALDFYGTEKLAWWLQQANSQYLDLLFLPAGLTLQIPDKPAGYDAGPRAPWTTKLTETAS